MRMTGAQIIVKLLEQRGVGVVAGIPGGPILPLYEALAGSSIRNVLARHEQGAGFIAQGLARVTGKAGVCMASSGPGATNLITALADARMDSVPLVALTAQVPQGLIGTDAFQEVDMYGLSLPVTKHVFQVRRVEDLVRLIPEAFRLAEAPRRGPVVVDIPKDVLTAVTDDPVLGTGTGWIEALNDSPEPAGYSEFVDRVSDLVSRARNPVVYAGGGLRNAFESLRKFASREGIPVAVTLMGLGLLDPADPLLLGMVGMHGSKDANRRMAEADLVLALGVRFDDRATGRIQDFCPQATVVHIDTDPSEFGKNHPAHLSWKGDAGKVLESLWAGPRLRPPYPQWKRETPAGNPAQDQSSAVTAQKILQTAARVFGPRVRLTTDVGQHQMWAAQYYPVARPGLFLTSGGLGTMGFGLPAAIGAALAEPETPCLCLTGDGSILMNVQELATLAELDLPVGILVFNNRRLGLVRQQQELFYAKRYTASSLESGPDFRALAAAFGIRSWRVGDGEPLEPVLTEARSHRGPFLVELLLPSEENVFPMVPPGAANHQALEKTPVLN